jgi:hypothetical protein
LTKKRISLLLFSDHGYEGWSEANRPPYDHETQLLQSTNSETIFYRMYHYANGKYGVEASLENCNFTRKCDSFEEAFQELKARVKQLEF